MLDSDFRSGLPYTLNSELHVRPDRIPSGVQGQAFELALSRLTIGYTQKKAQLLGSGAISGFQPGWQQRIQSYINFLDKAFSKLAAKANVLGVTYRAANAPLQTTEGSNWNAWSGNALQNVADAVEDFAHQVKYAARNAPLTGQVPVSFQALSKSSNVPLPAVQQTGVEGLDLFENTTWHVPAAMGVALGGLGVWWLMSRRMGEFY